MSLVNPNLPTWTATGGPKPNEILKLLPQALAEPGMVGMATGMHAADILAGNFADHDALLALLLPDQPFRTSIVVQPCSADAGYATLTVSLSILGKPPADTLIPFCPDPALTAYVIQAIEAYGDHLDEIAMFDRCEGISLGGACSVIDTSEWRPSPGSRTQAASYLAMEPGLTGDVFDQRCLAAQVQITQAAAQRFPGTTLLMTMLDPIDLAFGGKKDGAAYATQVILAMAAVKGSCTLAIMYESARPGRPVPAFFADLYTQHGIPIALQEEEGYIFNDPVPGALLIERHITDWKPDFVDLGAQAQVAAQ